MWAVTMTFDIEPLDLDAMMRLEAALEGHDAAVANVPGDAVTVTAYEQGGDPIEAASTARDAVVATLEAEPVMVEIEDEHRHAERAGAATLPTLVSAPEVGEILDVSRQRVHQLQANAQFPEPLYRLRTGPIWDARAIERFARNWDRKAGRPRSRAS